MKPRSTGTSGASGIWKSSASSTGCPAPTNTHWRVESARSRSDEWEQRTHGLDIHESLSRRWDYSWERRLERFEWKLNTPTSAARLVGGESQFGGTKRATSR